MNERFLIPESQKEDEINLSALTFDFISDDEVTSYCKGKLYELEDRDKWITENEEKIEQNKENILKAVNEGLIPNSEPETIWQLQIKETENKQENILRLKKELENNIEFIKQGVIKKLAEFLPNWNLKEAAINFTINEKSDSCVNGSNIMIDLSRLAMEENPIETTVHKITHEIFHIWMSEK